MTMDRKEVSGFERKRKTKEVKEREKKKQKGSRRKERERADERKTFNFFIRSWFGKRVKTDRIVFQKKRGEFKHTQDYKKRGGGVEKNREQKIMAYRKNRKERERERSRF